MPRQDLAKTLCERERRRSKDKFHYYRGSLKQQFLKDPEGSGGLLTNGRIYGYNNKDFNENLSPLKGFLHKASKQKRRWDDVYSELCHLLDKRSVINQHVFDHLWQYVCKSPRTTIDGDVQIFSAQRGWVPAVDGGYDYYIHPETNILTKIKFGGGWRKENEQRREKKAAELRKTYRRIDDHHSYQKIDGVWYHVSYATYPCQEITKMVKSTYDERRTYPQTRYMCPYVYDVVKKQTVGGDVTSEVWQTPSVFKVALIKRQVSKKEIKTQKL